MILKDLDVAREAGGSLRTFVKEFDATGGEGGLEIHFTAKVGKAIISGIEILSK